MGRPLLNEGPAAAASSEPPSSTATRTRNTSLPHGTRAATRPCARPRPRARPCARRERALRERALRRWAQAQLGIQNIRAVACIYMALHAIVCFLAHCIAAYAWYSNFWPHTIFISAMFFLAANNGAKLYQYYMLDVYDEKVTPPLPQTLSRPP